MQRQALAAHAPASEHNPHEHVLGLIDLARKALTAGNVPTASAILASALDHVVSESPVANTLADEFMELARGWFRAKNWQQTLNALRVGVALKPDHSVLRNELDHFLVNCKLRAKLTDYTQAFGEEELGRRLLVTASPKSGSTFFTNILAELTGWPLRYLSYAFMQNEGDLYLPYLVDTACENSVTQQHARATAANIHLLQGFAVKPIVQIRDVFDALLSFKEFLDNGAYFSTFYPTYLELEDAQRMDLVIDDRAAWYLTFYAGWCRAMRDGAIDGVWVRYEDLIADTVGTVRRVAAFQGLSYEDRQIEAAIGRVGKERQRFNRGVSGRGRKAFNAAQQERVERLARCHPDVDFTPIGL